MNAEFPSSRSVCNDNYCAFTNKCDKVGKDEINFEIQLVDGMGAAQKRLVIYSNEMFIDGEFFMNGKPGMCYLKIFNMGDPSVVQKRNAWVFGKSVMSKFYMIFDGSIKVPGGATELQIGFANLSGSNRAERDR